MSSTLPFSRTNRPTAALIREIVLAMKDNSGLGKMPGSVHICPSLHEGARLSPMKGVSVEASGWHI